MSEEEVINKSWPVVDHYGDLSIYFDAARDEFVIEIEPGHLVRHETCKGVRARVDADAERKEKVSKAKLTPVLVLRVKGKDTWGGSITPNVLEEVFITGIHAGSGHALVKGPAGKTTQVGYANGYFKPMTQEEIEKWNKIEQEYARAHNAREAFRKNRSIDGQLAKYASSIWGVV